LDAIADEPELAGYGYLPAARADMLSRLGRHEEAIAAYRAAIEVTTNEVELDFLESRIRQLRAALLR
jgi:RNA polymerase sigma-70 factor (ECF subfamily)